jgi:hypothetical protein
MKTLKHTAEDPIYVFPEMKLRSLVPNYHIHVSVSTFYIPTICPPILLQQIGGQIVGMYNRSQIHECRNWERGRAVSFLGLFVSNFRYSVFAVQYIY